MTHDPTWAILREVAERLNEHVRDTTLQVWVERRRQFLSWIVAEGLMVGDNWTDVFEPVRRRRFLSSTWTQVQSIEQAARNIEAFLIERPDLQ